MPTKTNENLAGKRYGFLTCLQFVPDNSRYLKWLCRCDCGNTKTIMTQSLKSGLTVSCGCYGTKRRKETSRTHGDSGNKKRNGTYSSWANMMTRCEWGGHPSYKNYGAIGIRVCKRWHKYKNFKDDMGERPVNKSIDRLDNNKGYDPENCRWSSKTEQSLNKKKTRWVEYQEKRMPLPVFAESIGVSIKAFRSRLVRRKYDLQKTLESYGFKNLTCGMGF